MKKIIKESDMHKDTILVQISELIDRLEQLKEKAEGQDEIFKKEVTNFCDDSLDSLKKTQLVIAEYFKDYSQKQLEDIENTISNVLELVKVAEYAVELFISHPNLNEDASKKINKTFKYVRDTLSQKEKEIVGSLKRLDRIAQEKDDEMFATGVIHPDLKTKIGRTPWFKENRPIYESLIDILKNTLKEEYEVSDDVFDDVDEKKENEAFDKARAAYLEELKKGILKFADKNVDVDNAVREAEEYLENNYPDFGYDTDLNDMGDYDIIYTHFDESNPAAENALIEALYVNLYLSKPDENKFHREHPNVEKKEYKDEDDFEMDAATKKKLLSGKEDDEDIFDDDEDDFRVNAETRKKLLADLDTKDEDEAPAEKEPDLPMLPKDIDEKELEEAVNILIKKFVK